MSDNAATADVLGLCEVCNGAITAHDDTQVRDCHRILTEWRERRAAKVRHDLEIKQMRTALRKVSPWPA